MDFWITWYSRLYNRFRLMNQRKHLHLIGRSRNVLRTIRRFKGDGRAPAMINYLRKVEALLFEEVILSALEDAGLLVRRSKRYTGDGGIDGHVRIKGWGWVPLQIKRYREHIANDHVRQFGELVTAGGYRAGLFIHTGRTGEGVYRHLRGHPILLISGQKLVNLLGAGLLDLGPLRRHDGHSSVPA